VKQKDFITIIIIVFISGLISYFIANAIIGAPKNRSRKVEVVEKISDEFNTPDPKYFNSESINPTKLIEIGDTNNPTPFH
jgi:hypothetical protein